MAEATQLAMSLAKLAEAIDGMNKVPPPVPFSGETGAIQIEDFLTSFERYCRAIYKEDHTSWLQVLPSFLEGEARAVVLAHGHGAGVTYQTVRDRLRLEVKAKC